ncbi:MAG: aldo/keto reductase, partial [Planktomarina sp.]
MLAPNGSDLSRMGIGAMSFSSFYGDVTRDQVFAVLDAAIELGVNHIDTANVYGMGVSEAHIGAYFAANPAARGHFHLASKGGITDKSDPNRPFNNSKEFLSAELDASLTRLGVDHLDLYYVHRRDQSIPIEEVTETLAGFVAAGKIRAFGYSELSPTS